MNMNNEEKENEEKKTERTERLTDRVYKINQTGCVALSALQCTCGDRKSK